MGFNEDNCKPNKIHIISADGGRPEQPVPSPGWQGVPTWTADGSWQIFGDNGPTLPIRESCSIHLFDFKSGRTSDLPGSTGLWTARACPAGRYIAAVTRDDRKLVLYDMRTAAWTELAIFPDSVIGDGIQRAHGNMGMWIGLTPDNLPLILRAVQWNEIYAWDWTAP